MLGKTSYLNVLLIVLLKQYEKLPDIDSNPTLTNSAVCNETGKAPSDVIRSAS